MNELAVVMVVSASERGANAIAQMLRMHGLTVEAMANPESALRRLEKFTCDMVIAESNLYGMTGLQFLEKCRVACPMALRALVQSDPLQGDPRALINHVGLTAVLDEEIDPGEVWRLIVMEGPLGQASSNESGERQLRTKDLERESRRLQDESRLLNQEISRLQRENARLIAQQSGAVRPAAREVESNSSNGSRARATREQGADRVRKVLMALIDDPSIALPVLPMVARDVQRLMADEDTCNVAELTKLIEIEQGIAARLLQVANSVMYAGLERISNLQHAVARLGVRRTRSILNVVIVEHLFRTPNRALKRLMARLWLHSLCVAYGNEHIAMTTRISAREDYFMMGLLHDIGKLLVLHLLQEGIRREKLTNAEVTEDLALELTDSLHLEFGRRLVRAWNYSEEFLDVVEHHGDEDVFRKHGPAVIVTYVSNLLARKMNYSLKPYDGVDPLENAELLDALNMRAGARLLVEDYLRQRVDQICSTYFPGVASHLL